MSQELPIGALGRRPKAAYGSRSDRGGDARPSDLGVAPEVTGTTLTPGSGAPGSARVDSDGVRLDLRPGARPDQGAHPSGYYHQPNSPFFYIYGRFNNVNGISLNAGVPNAVSNLCIGRPDDQRGGETPAPATLIGGGQVTLSDSSDNAIGPSTDQPVGGKLTNVDNTISGAGLIETSGLVNEAAGVIDASGALNTLRLVIATPGAKIANAGLIEATGAAGLFVASTIIDDSGGGALLAGDGSVVTLANSDVIGGGLETAGAGYFLINGSTTFDGRGKAANNPGLVNVVNGSLTLEGAFRNAGTVAIALTGDGRDSLRIGADTTLTGGGAITLNSADDHIAAYAYGAHITPTLTNVDNTISGAGVIGQDNSQLTLVNQAKGVIDANGASGLTIETDGNAITNAGLIEATGAGGLTINATTIDDSSGGILMAGAGSTVTLTNDDVVGGRLKTSGNGAFQASNTYFDGRGSTVYNQGQVNAVNGNLTLEGVFRNAGTVAVAITGDGRVTLRIAADTTLTGGGVITLNSADDHIAAYAYRAHITPTLTNASSTIAGAGVIGQDNSQLTLVNQAKGVIDANGASGLTIETDGNAITNAGLIEATGAGGLTIASSQVNGAGGTILAGSGSTVRLESATLTGGRLATATGGTISILNGSSATVDGTFANAGTISLSGSAGATSLILDKKTTLTRGGSVILNDNNLEGTATSVVLTNVDNTISGSGLLGGGKLTLINEAGGVIDATGALTIGPGPKAIVNAGLIEASAGGVGVVAGAIANTGLLEANGGNLTVEGAVSGAGSAAVKGGRLAFASSFTEDVAFTGAKGTLQLAQSRNYTGSVSGFSKTGQTALDLEDIRFVGAGEATYTGTKTSGVLTVTDGTHTASIDLIGDYRGTIFTARRDGNGGTKVVAMPAGATASHATFIAAMASAGAGAGVAAWQDKAPLAHAPPSLFAPRESHPIA